VTPITCVSDEKTVDGFGKGDNFVYFCRHPASALGPTPTHVGESLGPGQGMLRSYLFSGGFALQGALQGLVQGGFGAFVFLLRNASLLVFDLELEEFFLQTL